MAGGRVPGVTCLFHLLRGQVQPPAPAAQPLSSPDCFQHHTDHARATIWSSSPADPRPAAPKFPRHAVPAAAGSAAMLHSTASLARQPLCSNCQWFTANMAACARSRMGNHAKDKGYPKERVRSDIKPERGQQHAARLTWGGRRH